MMEGIFPQTWQISVPSVMRIADSALPAVTSSTLGSG
jgi:hypothetical protein